MTLRLRTISSETVSRDRADREVVERCLEGDRNAFLLIMRRHGTAINAYCSHAVGPSMGEELAQETFARAWSALASFRGASSLKAWIYRIALNLCLDYLKSRWEREVPTEVGADEVDTSADPEQHAVGREGVAALARALARLAPKYRQPLLLKHVEDLSYDEMKGVLGMGVPAMKVRVHRARAQLRDLMEEEMARGRTETACKVAS